MIPDERARLLKLLGMTGSVHDGEALNALRMATALMKRCRVTWSDLLGGAVRSERPGAGHARAGASPFRDAKRQYDEAASAARRAMEELEKEMRRQGRSADMSADEQSVRAAMEEERRAVALARLRLDEILKRPRLDGLKREHFEAVRARHIQTGHINVAHRAQIDRAYYSQGWDEPLGDGM